MKLSYSLIILFLLITSKVFAVTHPHLKTMMIAGYPLAVEVAATPDEIKQGLMGRHSLPNNQGMLFLYDKVTPVVFWMYHTEIPLDMIFVKEGRVIKVLRDLPPCKSDNPMDCPYYPDNHGIEVSCVIEVNAGYAEKHHLMIGDTVILP